MPVNADRLRLRSRAQHAVSVGVAVEHARDVGFVQADIGRKRSQLAGLADIARLLPSRPP